VELLEIKSDALWWVSNQSFEGWESNRSDTATQKIFGPVGKSAFSEQIEFAGKTPDPIWDLQKSDKVFLRRIISTTQKITSAFIDITAEEDYTLYVNGDKVAIDTKYPGDFKEINSYEVTDKIVVGNNLIAIQAESKSQNKAILISIEMTAEQGIKSPEKIAVAKADDAPNQVEELTFNFKKRDLAELKAIYTNHNIYKEELIAFQEKEQKLARTFRSEQNKINFLKNQIEDIENQTYVLDAELEHYKNKLLEMKR